MEDLIKMQESIWEHLDNIELLVTNFNVDEIQFIPAVKKIIGLLEDEIKSIKNEIEIN